MGKMAEYKTIFQKWTRNQHPAGAAVPKMVKKPWKVEGHKMVKKPWKVEGHGAVMATMHLFVLSSSHTSS